jgi:hypothetical protein
LKLRELMLTFIVTYRTSQPGNEKLSMTVGSVFHKGRPHGKSIVELLGYDSGVWTLPLALIVSQSSKIVVPEDK